MKKYSKAFIISSSFIFLLGCSEGDNNEEEASAEENNANNAVNEEENEENEEENEEENNEEEEEEIEHVDDIFKSDITLDFDTDMEEPEAEISKEEYEKHNEIMDYLYANPEQSEQELYAELESDYDKSADELEEFIEENYEEVIAYDSGDSANDVSIEDTEVKNTSKEFFSENVKDEDRLSIDEEQAEVTVTNRRTISEGSFTYAEEDYDYILNTEYTEDFQSVSAFQLKVDEINIDLE
ncbi:hypothetical protein [Salisediminibacterium halotolerans]|uniref:hypothetical protein n=1 Tax=Salisediminibacterium halotolerans TaxID=517425 RepID=UPI000F0E5618|nr:hypothetical protein [Salisediminibacterium halotolerans]RLJ72214.1 hypothetical protein BCL39_2107 [Actinophytocola xinjiangensis]RPE85427.1 hypothetical protein EDD67_2242 [Salisediminibacterium halotolerans]TWG33384.1 hypothetical protein BCL52_2103 [Salisediminibacterium halotolerans]GEL07087.1 hypothetical protein SHA02_05030 [Salisediminibacterium halotolerans]